MTDISWPSSIWDHETSTVFCSKERTAISKNKQPETIFTDGARKWLNSFAIKVISSPTFAKDGYNLNSLRPFSEWWWSWYLKIWWMKIYFWKEFISFIKTYRVSKFSRTFPFRFEVVISATGTVEIFPSYNWINVCWLVFFNLSKRTETWLTGYTHYMLRCRD